MRSILVRLALATALAAPLVVASEQRAHAFCGFYVAPGDQPLYNDASMVALMRDGTRTVMSMSNNYRGPASDFAMVVPVPVVLKKEDVKTLPLDTFKKLEALSAPRLVEYWEQDPCPSAVYAYPPTASMAPMAKGELDDISGGGKKKDYGVKIEAKFTVGEYQILVLSAKESDGLESWLRDNKYNIPSGASAALAPYISAQQKFFVAKIDIKKVKIDAQGAAVLSPLRFAFESQDFRLPVRLGLLNAKQKQDLLVFTLSRSSRYEVSNYPSVFIPTNLDVTNDARDKFTPFYAALFDEAVAKGNGRGIVTEYSWESSSCDPCPTPPLADSDLATLGGDVLFGMGAPPPEDAASGSKKSSGYPPGYGGYYGGSTPMVLTRLHARYDQTSLSDDLIFTAAEAIVGGREFVIGSKGELEQGAKPSSSNNFQARYAIRHPWTGPIKCKDPRRGIWGGPPAGVAGSTAPRPATNLASAARGSVKYDAYLKAGVPAFLVKDAVLPALPTPDGGIDDDAGAANADAPAEGDASFGAPAGASTVPSTPPSQHGCMCDVPGASGGGGSGLASVGVPAALIALGRAAQRSRAKKRGPRR